MVVMLGRLRLAVQYFRRAGAAFVGVTAIAVGQAVLHDRAYEPLPELRFAKAGMELPRIMREKREELARRLHRSEEQLKNKIESWVSRKAAAIEERPLVIKNKIQSWAREAREEPVIKNRIESWAQRLGLSREAAIVVPLVKEKKVFRVLFIGDSLVTGVGASQSSSVETGPPLPRRVCRALADHLGVEVEWRALGINGCDVAAMRLNLIPELSTPPGYYDCAVVMCGLNDFKHIARGELRTPWSFRNELDGLVGEMRAQLGENCRILLPALPIALAAFREPLRSYVVFVADLWDAQKRALAARLSSEEAMVAFVEVMLPQQDAGLVAADGVHPSERGYELWAQHIAVALLSSSSSRGLILAAAAKNNNNQ